jgi:hypothetical protein
MLRAKATTKKAGEFFIVKTSRGKLTDSIRAGWHGCRIVFKLAAACEENLQVSFELAQRLKIFLDRGLEADVLAVQFCHDSPEI